MTEKQALVIKLNGLREKLGWAPLRDKEVAKRSIGVIKANIELAERELAKAA